MKKYAVITGASSGIGEVFAKKLAGQGYPLVLIARRKERLQMVAEEVETKCEIITADLSVGEECLRVCELLKEKEIEIFINNAGFGDCGKFVETELKKELSMIDVNVCAMHIFAKEMLKKMQSQQYGFILNVASSAGLMPGGPYMSTYYATKSYVTSLTQGVAQELREMKSPVYLGCLCPGPVDTEFNSVANVEFALKGISADFCVDYALKMMKKKKMVIVPSLKMRIAMVAGRYLPLSVYIKIAAHQQKKKFFKKQ